MSAQARSSLSRAALRIDDDAIDSADPGEPSRRFDHVIAVRRRAGEVHVALREADRRSALPTVQRPPLRIDSHIEPFDRELTRSPIRLDDASGGRAHNGMITGMRSASCKSIRNLPAADAAQFQPEAALAWRSQTVVCQLAPWLRNAMIHTAETAPIGAADPPAASWKLGRLVAKQQTAALLATAVDYLVMTACVRAGRLHPATATACGAAVGTVVGFSISRRWVFAASSGSRVRQLWRYCAVSLLSLVMNCAGEGLLVHAGLHYLAARPAVSLTVGLGWNLPMQSCFVFRRRPRLPLRKSMAQSSRPVA